MIDGADSAVAGCVLTVNCSYKVDPPFWFSGGGSILFHGVFPPQAGLVSHAVTGYIVIGSSQVVVDFTVERRM